MASSPVITQLISFLLMPAIARLYSPALFGLFNVFSSIFGPFLTFSNCGYHHAIVLPKKDTDGSTLIYGNIIISLISSIIVLVLVFLTPENIWYKLKIEQVINYWWIIPTTIFLHGINTAFSVWNQRKTKFKVIAISRVINALVNKVYILFMGLIGYANTGSLILGSLIGLGTMTIVQIGPFIKKKILFPHFNQIIFELIKYKKFPLYIMSSDLLFRATSAIIFILFIFYFSEVEAGYYGMAMMIAGVPTVLIGTAIGEVFYQKAAAEKTNKNNELVYVELFKKLYKISFFSFVVLAFLSNELFNIFLGPEWEQAGNFTRILCFQMFISFIMIPIINLAKIYNKQEYTFIEQLLVLITSSLAIYIGGILNNINIALLLLSPSTGFINLFFGLLIFQYVGISFRKILAIIIKYTLYSLPLSFLIFIIKYNYDTSKIEILTIGAFCMVIHYSFILFTDNELSNSIKNILQKIKLS